MANSIIEEMSEDLYEAWRSDIIIGNKYEWVMERLYNKSYRKTPENAVVLTRGEYEQIQDKIELLKENEDIGNALFRSNELCRKLVDDKKKLKQELKQARKETVEKFVREVEEFFKPFDKKSPIFLDLLITKIENIAKEITEG